MLKIINLGVPFAFVKSLALFFWPFRAALTSNLCNVSQGSHRDLRQLRTKDLFYYKLFNLNKPLDNHKHVKKNSSKKNNIQWFQWF